MASNFNNGSFTKCYLSAVNEELVLALVKITHSFSFDELIQNLMEKDAPNYPWLSDEALSHQLILNTDQHKHGASANLVLPGITSHYKLRDPCYSMVTEGYGMLCSTTRGYGVLCSKTKVCWCIKLFWRKPWWSLKNDRNNRQKVATFEKINVWMILRHADCPENLILTILRYLVRSLQIPVAIQWILCGGQCGCSEHDSRAEQSLNHACYDKIHHCHHINT